MGPRPLPVDPYKPLTPPLRAASTIAKWENEILAFHSTGRVSNGRLEGTNNLLQVLRRVAHGFTNPANYQARGILTCPAVT